jgi:hypothetical protein
MPLKQDELNRQLSRANKTLADWSGILKERGVADDQRHRDPVWRSLNAQCRQLSLRMRTSAEVVTLDEELKKRKAEKTQAVTAPEEKKPKPKQKTEKKKADSDKAEKKVPKKKAKKKTKK